MTGTNPFAPSFVEAPLDERELEPDEVALQVVEPAPRDARGRLGVDQPQAARPGEIEVVSRLEPELRRLPVHADDLGVLLRRAGGRGRVGDVRDAEHHLADGGFGLRQRRLVGRLLLLQLRLAGDLGCGVLAALLRLGDRLRGCVSIGPRLLDPRQELASAGVDGEELVHVPHGLLAAAGERRFVPSGSARICLTSSIRDVSLLTRPGSPRPRHRRRSARSSPRSGGVRRRRRRPPRPGPAVSSSSTSFAPSPNATTVRQGRCRAGRTRTRAQSPCSRPGAQARGRSAATWR